MHLRNRRMDAEWQLLQALANANPATFAEILRLEEGFRCTMQLSPAWVKHGSERRVETEHVLRYVYPRYYPSLPLEGYFVRPIVHLNVDPATGFACLWQEYRPAQTIIDAILITRAIMAHRVANQGSLHQMQPDAGELCELPMPPLALPAECRPAWPGKSGGRRRLSSEFNEEAPRETTFAFSDTE